jgi:Ca2+/Na+ antiporter
VILLELLREVTKFIVYCAVIVLISKYVLVTNIRKLAQNLNLKPRTVGNIAGYATSVPEFLTVSVSSFNGLLGAGIYNVLSSNVMNFLQYLTTVFINKNQRKLSNLAIKTDIVLVIVTILIPIFLIIAKIKITIWTAVVFIVLYIIFRYINGNAHKLYIQKNIKDEEIKEKSNSVGGNFIYILFLILSGILLFFVGNLLGTTLENLCYRFKVPQIVIGILLGFITSIPELITFIESQKHHKKTQDDLLGVVEATNNLFTSNVLNLFIIQSIGVLIYVVFA